MTTETNIANTAAADTSDSTEAADTITEVPMRVLKVGTTASLSNRSTLSYAVGCNDSNSIFLSLRSNTGSGMFSKNCVAFLDIAEALVLTDKVTSGTLRPLYANTSNNNTGFMLAVLLAEGLVCPQERHYVRQDFKPFEQHINALIAAGVDLGDADEALEAVADVAAADVHEADVTEVDAPVVMPAAKRGRPSKRA